MPDPANVKALTFDLFGTVLDLGTSLREPIEVFLKETQSDITAEQFWDSWRLRQRLEQYRDTMMALGHSGYLATVERAMRYVAAERHVNASTGDFDQLMAAWWRLSPFPETVAALGRLSHRYRLVVLSNGDPEYLQHLARERVRFEFDDVFSVTSVGVFKPHPAVYRGAAMHLGLELHECLMVSSNSFDVIGARASGMQAAYVDRYHLPMEESAYEPTLHVVDFTELAEALL